MDLATLAQLGEFIGGFFVVVSLVYLAYQVRQNTPSLRSENYARVLERLSALQWSFGSDAELNRIVVQGALDIQALRPSQRMRLTWSLYELFGAFVYELRRTKPFDADAARRWKAFIGAPEPERVAPPTS